MVKKRSPWPFGWGFVFDGPGRLFAGGNRRQERGGWALVDEGSRCSDGSLNVRTNRERSDDALAVTKMV
jgi:hypothetical protein